MERVFSGVQPSGVLHIGNYLGAIKNWVDLQDSFQCFFCVVDLHAITVPQSPQELSAKILEIAKIYLAAGIEPRKSVMFIQSQIQEHAELCWILNTITRLPELERMTQFKEKAEKHRKEASLGLFDYPVLMAADILLYRTAVVPVGEDQVQHVELARDLAQRFNNRFGEIFVAPKALVRSDGARIMGLDDPFKKMSKSADSIYSYIALTDSPDLIREKIKKAVTDSGKEVVFRRDKPALANLLTIYSLLDGRRVAEIEKMYAGRGYADFKNGLAEAIIGFLKSFQQKYVGLKDEEILSLLRSGAEQAKIVAQETMREVKKEMGFII